MKKLGLMLVAVVLVMIAGCADDDDGKEACEAYALKCPAGAAGAVSCSPDRVNDAVNGGEVEDCIQGAADCAAATACYNGLK